MKNARPFTTADYNRIVSIVRPVIIAKFNNLSQEDIDEIMSSTLVKIAISWDRYDESISKKSWFEVTAVRCAQKYYTYADSSLYSEENMSYIKRAVGSLNDRERTAIEMDLQGYSADEIQATLGVSYANLRTIKSRGRAKLLQDSTINGMMQEYFGRVA